MISDYEADRKRKRAAVVPKQPTAREPVPDSPINTAMREQLGRSRQTRDAKMARVFAKPAQVTRSGNDIIVRPPSRRESPVQEAKREATAARKRADTAKANLQRSRQK